MTIAKKQYEQIGVRPYLPEGPYGSAGNTPFPNFAYGSVVAGEAEAEFVFLALTVETSLTLNQGDVLVWDNSFQAVVSQTGSGVHPFGASVGTFFLGGNLDCIEEFASGGQWSCTFPVAGVYGVWVQRAGVSLMNIATVNAQSKPLNTTAVNGQVNAPASALVGSMGIQNAWAAPTSWTFTANTVTGSVNLTNVSQSKGQVIGQTLSGTGIPNGTYIKDIQGGIIVMSAAATATNTGTTVTAANNSTWGATTNLSAALTSVPNIPGIYPNQTIAGTGIPASTTILSITGAPGNYTINMSAAATATAASINFTTTIYIEALLRWPQIGVQN
jgi:hypothetical protein